MSSELSLLVELYNPLYLFPIVGVVFTALMVYAFGFKSSAQPPTEVVEALNDRHHKNHKTFQEPVKRKKQTQKVSTAKTEIKTQSNEHIGSDLSRSSDKKTQKKVTPEQSSPSKEAKTSKRLKAKKSQEINEVEIDDQNAGEWVELVSKKERKNRKQKEEQLLLDSKESKANKDEKTSDKSPKKPKKSKSPKNVEVNGTSTEKTIKESEEKPKSEEPKPEEPKQAEFKKNKDLVPSADQNGVVTHEESGTDGPDIYELAKEQRAPKKLPKQKNKRNSESEQNSKLESLESEEKSNLNLSDKLTASIVANYEGNDKTDNVPNKKKEKKKKQIVKDDNKSNDKQVSNSEVKEEKTLNEKVIETSDVNGATIATDANPPEEEFKVVNKKRRARRE